MLPRKFYSWPFLDLWDDCSCHRFAINFDRGPGPFRDCLHFIRIYQFRDPWPKFLLSRRFECWSGLCTIGYSSSFKIVLASIVGVGTWVHVGLRTACKFMHAHAPKLAICVDSFPRDDPCRVATRRSVAEWNQHGCVSGGNFETYSIMDKFCFGHAHEYAGAPQTSQTSSWSSCCPCVSRHIATVCIFVTCVAVKHIGHGARC